MIAITQILCPHNVVVVISSPSSPASPSSETLGSSDEDSEAGSESELSILRFFCVAFFGFVALLGLLAYLLFRNLAKLACREEISCKVVIFIEMSIRFLKLCANGSPRICKFVGQYCLVFDQIDRVPFILIQSRLDHFIQLISQPLLGFVFAFHQLQHLNPLCFVEMLLVKRDLSRLAEQNQSGNDPILKPVGQHILEEEREIIADYIDKRFSSSQSRVESSDRGVTERIRRVV